MRRENQGMWTVLHELRGGTHHSSTVLLMKVITVTGGLGFIGRNVVDMLLHRGDRVFLVDAETYAADVGLLDHDWKNALHYGFLKYVKSDINDLENLPDVDAIINLAAETHVDNSLTDPERFLRSNYLGVQHLLELVRGKRAYQMPLFIQISTDEVYGSVGTGETTEASPLAPSSPYAASKAAGDLLVQAYGHSFELPWRIVRPSNCYGLHQFPEKLIPKAVRHLSLGRNIPIHEDGSATRYWLDVEDCARAILCVLDSGENGEIYNIAGNTEMSVRGVASRICEIFGVNPSEALDFQYQRLGLDRRYHVADTKLRALGWTPHGDLARDLPQLVESERKASFRW
jgi:dTDP-glucose 4,6-dehydratase